MKKLKYYVSSTLLSVFILTGCGVKEEQGDIIIGLTDAQGDFIAYNVDVAKLTLTKANGTVVDTLPETTRIDFAQYVDMTEFLTAATIPSGVYTKATLTLDYTNADIQVEAADGSAQKVTTIVDSNGNALQQVDVSVQLTDRNRLAIVPGVPAVITFDFDLAATNKVEFTGDVPTVTVEPVLVAGIDAEFDKSFRLRGLLKNVDTAQNTFTVVVRPLFHALKNGDERFGAMKVSVSDTTQFEVNGETYTGSDGVVALSELDKNSAVVINGTMNFSTRTFNASDVSAGDSVPGATKDVITGNVIKREGNMLTIRGATLERAQGSVTFHDTVSVLLADTTTVRRAGAGTSETFDTTDISVGQRLIAFGTIDTTATATTLNANHVRMMHTSVRGEVTQVSGSQIDIRLQSIDNRRASLYDFTGTGATVATYEVDISNLSSVNVGSVIRAIGFPVEFGTQTPDFTAKTVVSLDERTMPRGPR